MTSWLFLSLWGAAFLASGWLACRLYLHFSGRLMLGGLRRG